MVKIKVHIITSDYSVYILLQLWLQLSIHCFIGPRSYHHWHGPRADGYVPVGETKDHHPPSPWLRATRCRPGHPTQLNTGLLHQAHQDREGSTTALLLLHQWLIVIVWFVWYSRMVIHLEKTKISKICGTLAWTATLNTTGSRALTWSRRRLDYSTSTTTTPSTASRHARIKVCTSYNYVQVLD